MYYGDDVVVTKRGLIVKEKSLVPIGISDKSICWGIESLFVPDEHGCKKGQSHLIISPFPPQRWHSLFQILIQLQRKSGMMLKASKVLRDFGINILSNQCATVGHKKALWQIVGEDEYLKKELEEILPDIVSNFNKNYDKAINNSNENLEDFIDEITEKVCLQASRRSIHIQDILRAKGQNTFLIPAFRNGRSILFRKSFINELCENNEESNYHFETLNQRIIETNNCIKTKFGNLENDFYDIFRLCARQVQLFRVLQDAIKSPQNALLNKNFRNHVKKHDECTETLHNCELEKSTYFKQIPIWLEIRKKRLSNVLYNFAKKLSDLNNSNLKFEVVTIFPSKNCLNLNANFTKIISLIKDFLDSYSKTIPNQKKYEEFIDLKNLFEIIEDASKFLTLENSLFIDYINNKLKDLNDFNGLLKKAEKTDSSSGEVEKIKTEVEKIKKELKEETFKKRKDIQQFIHNLSRKLETEYLRRRNLSSHCSGENSFEILKELFSEMINLESIRDKINENVAQRYKLEINRSVKTYWLRRMAIYRIYSELQKTHPKLKHKLIASFDDPIKFKYDASSEMLIPDDDLSRDKYKEFVKLCFGDQLPSKIVAAFNPREHYIRVNFPRKLDKIFVKLDYDFRLDTNDNVSSSKGLLTDVLDILAKRQFNGTYISNTIINYEEGKRESGFIYIIGYFED